MPKARLRTKSGCLTCRKRRIKCGEERPSCINCTSISRLCDWPSTVDLYDRRNRHNCVQRQSPLSDTNSEASSDDDRHETGACWAIQRYQCLRPNPVKPAFHSEVEVELVYHYLDKLLYVLHLPNVPWGFYSDYRNRVVSMMLYCDSVKCAVMACCASNKYMLSNEPRYQRIALRYYSQAVEKVKSAVAELDYARKSPDDALLITVVYLYLFSLWGPDTAVDAPKHVAGAVQLLTLRYADTSSPLSMSRPFDRIVTESVLYQVFLLSMRNPFSPKFHVDERFFSNTGKILKSLTFANRSAAENSPVLGLPLPLYRLITNMIEYYDTPHKLDTETLDQLKQEMAHWENAVVGLDDPGSGSPLLGNPHSNIVTLYILAASLLLNWTIEMWNTQTHKGGNPLGSMGLSMGHILRHRVADSSRWQVARALSVIRKPITYESWTRCFLGTWPMLILGYAVDTDEDIALIKQVLRQMRQRMGYGEVQRVLDEVEAVWQRNQGKGQHPRIEEVDSTSSDNNYIL